IGWFMALITDRYPPSNSQRESQTEEASGPSILCFRPTPGGSRLRATSSETRPSFHPNVRPAAGSGVVVNNYCPDPSTGGAGAATDFCELRCPVRQGRQGLAFCHPVLGRPLAAFTRLPHGLHMFSTCPYLVSARRWALQGQGRVGETRPPICT